MKHFLALVKNTTTIIIIRTINRKKKKNIAKQATSQPGSQASKHSAIITASTINQAALFKQKRKK